MLLERFYLGVGYVLSCWIHGTASSRIQHLFSGCRLLSCQDLYQSLWDLMETLLKDLLAEAPNLEHLLRILEVSHVWKEVEIYLKLREGLQRGRGWDSQVPTSHSIMT